MCTSKIYEQMMIQHHGDWADFFMDSTLEEDMHNATATPGHQKATHKPAVLHTHALEAA